ncbi:MAG TPA: glycosyltransferase [Myxococcales bacterium]|jgi:cellulose synthase/poly-beta-1,6-N-acetylglucosamine synthase-like glycosyltransferase/spore germination protein YaaH/peptidoglycan/xylan/chitin deacetylase (PgdA/CDA1 family)
MAVFLDESGRRARAVRIASVLGAASAIGALVAFAVSVVPARLSPVPPDVAPLAKPPKPEPKAREKAYRAEEARLHALLAQAERAQKRRIERDPREPVLAAFAVNWDPQSLASLRAHADELTQVMPEWIHLAKDGTIAIDSDAQLAEAAGKVEIVPTVSNYLDQGFQRALLRPLLATDATRKAAAARLLDLCEQHGFAGLNLDFEDLDAPLWQRYVQFVEAVHAELHPRGLSLSVDLPADAKGVPVERLAAASDFLVVMAYDEHASTDNPGPIATPAFVAESVAAYLRRAPSQKIVVAVGAYGYDWPLDSDGDTARPAEELSFGQALALARENESPIDWDAHAQEPSFEYDDETKEKHEVHFLDAPALLAQLEAISTLNVRGVALWRLGAEDPKVFELFDPASRKFDPARARQRLDGSIAAHDPEDVIQTGEGEVLSLKARPQSGHRTLAWDPQGRLRSVLYERYPSGFILQRQGGHAKGKVLFTFDDGPDPRWTPKILDVLGSKGVKGVFLVIGQNAQNRPDLVRRELDEGHMIGNHSFTHPDLSRVSPLRMELEINVNERLLEWITGKQPKLFRPPYHSDEALDEAQNAQVIGRAGQLGFLTLGQDIDPEDFAQTNPDVIVQRVLDQAAKGSVILLHDGGGDRSATLAALPRIIDALAARGIGFATPEEMTGIPREQLLPPAPRAQTARFGADAVVFGVLGSVSRALGPLFAVAIGLLAFRALLLAFLAPAQARRARRRGKSQPPEGLTVSVVVPGYNEEAVIARTVDSLLAQEPPVLEVVCVDDGSKDRTLQVLHERFDKNPRVRIFGKENGGKASALNLGFAEARGEVVVALDSDTVFKPDTVAELTAPFADPKVGAVAGNAKVGNRVNRLTRWQALEYVTAQNLERRAWDLASAVPVVPGAVGAWRREAVLREGGFHEDTLAEDTDLTLRLIARGFRVVYAENALAYTEAPESSKSLLKQRFRWTYGVLQACWKHKSRLFRRGGGVLGWVILPAFAVYQFVVPLIAPVVDVLLLISLVRGQALATAVYYFIFFGLDLLLSMVAVLLEGEDLHLLIGLFVQRIAYRQLLWVALVKSLWHALAGMAVGWGKLARTGTVQIGGH